MKVFVAEPTEELGKEEKRDKNPLKMASMMDQTQEEGENLTHQFMRLRGRVSACHPCADDFTTSDLYTGE